MRRLGLAGIVLGLTLGACGGGGPRHDAAEAAHAVLTAAAAGDRVALEPLIDRDALRADLAGQLAAIGRAQGLDIPEGPSETALDRMISPSALRMADPVPPAKELGKSLKALGEDRVCLPQTEDADLCRLTFARRGTTWKLVGMHAPL